MITPPSGNVTFLFTDIEGSTKLAQLFPENLTETLSLHHKILEDVIESNNGFVFKTVGDAFCAAFESADDAVKASYEIQMRLLKEDWKQTPLKVRIGIHRGEAEFLRNDYNGYLTLSRTSRLMSVANGGQVLISKNVLDAMKSSADHGIKLIDLGERKLKDLIQPIRVFQLASEGLPSEFPQLKTLDSRPNNLPTQLTNFIGREDEFKKVKELIQETSVLTLTGSGGSGKTRLALQVGADLIYDFENGIWFIDLAPLVEDSLMIQEFLKALGVSENPLKNNEETLIDYLKDKELLIILDNCEHLIEACSKLVEKIVSNCSRVKIISTSREALKCSGEVTHRISSMSLPDLNLNLTAEKLSQYDSVKLFIDRALSVNSSFEINNENAPALAGICFQLDGIPLAIELAAARTKILSPAKIYEKLSDRFRLLTGGKRTALPRQQTLKAMIDWSHELVSPTEKILWRRLSVFKGGWTLEDVEDVCTDESLDPVDVMDSIQGLTEKSVIIYQEEIDRYTMLETIRQFGDEKLLEAGEVNLFFTKHLVYYTNLTKNSIPELTGPKAKVWLDKFEQEHSNLQSALSWAVAEKFYDEGCTIVSSLAKFWEIRGFISECRSWIDKLLEGKSKISKIVLAQTLKLGGIMCSIQGKYDEGRIYLNESLTIFRAEDNKQGASAVLNILGLNAMDKGEYVKAREMVEESLVLLKDTGNKIGIANMNNSLGLIYLAECNYEEAKKHYAECLKIARELKDEQYIGIGLNNLAEIEARLENYDEAEKLFREGLVTERELGNHSGIIVSLANLGSIAVSKEEFDKAIPIYDETLLLSRQIGFRFGIIHSLSSLGQVALSKREFDKSKSLFQECLREQKDAPDFISATNCILGMSEIRLIEKDPDSAAILAGNFEFVYESSGAIMEKNVKIYFDNLVKLITKELGEEKTIEGMKKGKELSFKEGVEFCISC